MMSTKMSWAVYGGSMFLFTGSCLQSFKRLIALAASLEEVKTPSLGWGGRSQQGGRSWCPSREPERDSAPGRDSLC